jgi:hypothetical protein
MPFWNPLERCSRIRALSSAVPYRNAPVRESLSNCKRRPRAGPGPDDDSHVLSQADALRSNVRRRYRCRLGVTLCSD